MQTSLAIVLPAEICAYQTSTSLCGTKTALVEALLAFTSLCTMQTQGSGAGGQMPPKLRLGESCLPKSDDEWWTSIFKWILLFEWSTSVSKCKCSHLNGELLMLLFEWSTLVLKPRFVPRLIQIPCCRAAGWHTSGMCPKSFSTCTKCTGVIAPTLDFQDTVLLYYTKEQVKGQGLTLPGTCWHAYDLQYHWYLVFLYVLRGEKCLRTSSVSMLSIYLALTDGQLVTVVGEIHAQANARPFACTRNTSSAEVN